MYYAKSTGGFYDDPANYPNFPTDAKEISDELYQILKSPPAGKMVSTDKKGNPVLVDSK